MPPEEQAELWMALRDRMKNDWHDLSFQERKAGKCALWSMCARKAPPLGLRLGIRPRLKVGQCIKKMSHIFTSSFIL